MHALLSQCTIIESILFQITLKQYTKNDLSTVCYALVVPFMHRKSGTHTLFHSTLLWSTVTLSSFTYFLMDLFLVSHMSRDCFYSTGQSGSSKQGREFRIQGQRGHVDWLLPAGYSLFGRW